MRISPNTQSPWISTRTQSTFRNTCRQTPLKIKSPASASPKLSKRLKSLPRTPLAIFTTKSAAARKATVSTSALTKALAIRLQSMKGKRSLRLTSQTIWIQVCFLITAQCVEWSPNWPRVKACLTCSAIPQRSLCRRHWAELRAV